MAMRVTTKMMQNTSLRNLNTSKAREEKLLVQLATGKKISRPSDDPVIAIRALKLNSSLDKINQYYEKNAKDAESWLGLTDSAIATVNKILTGEQGIRQYFEQAATGHLENDDRKDILDNISKLVEEIYSTGNASSAGRSLFTGYRTNLPLTFNKAKEENYAITEQLTNESIDQITYIKQGDLPAINEGNFNTVNTNEYYVSANDIYRIRLAYKDTAAIKQKVDANGNPKTDANGNPVYDRNITLSFGDFSNGGVTKTYSAENGDIRCFENATEDAYAFAIENPDKMVYIAETGEVLLGNDIQKELSELSSNTEIRVSYEKENWKVGDLDPIHYFYTERKEPVTDRTLKYNPGFLEGGSKQIIEYDIGNNQTIRVNTTADEVFDHGIGRDADELVNMLQQYGTLDNNYKTVQEMIASNKYEGEDLTKLEQHLEAIGKARTMMRDKIEKQCGAMLTRVDGYIANCTLAETSCGSRESQLTLVQNRLGVQKENYEELVSSNEDADYPDLAIQLNSIRMTYQAALSSISYVMQTSLLDFI